MNPDPDNWMDVFTIIMVAAIAAIPAWMAARGTHKVVRENEKEIATIRTQVVNGHKTPMRADMDDMRGVVDIIRVAVDAIKETVHGTKDDIIEIRKDLREERHCRIGLENRFGKHLDKTSGDHVTEQDWHDRF